MKRYFIIAIMLFAISNLNAQFKIHSSTFGNGAIVSGGSYILYGSTNQIHIGNSNGGSNKMKIGFWNTFLYKALAIPTLITYSAGSIEYNSASSGGNISDDAGVPITERGIVISTTTNPTLLDYDFKITSGTGLGSFNIDINGLKSNTTYYIKSFATNGVGTSYGNQVSFTTDAAPSPDNSSISLNYDQNGNTWEDNNSNNSDGTVPNGGGTPDGGDGSDQNFDNNPTWTFDGTNDCFQLPYNQNSGRLNQNSPKSLFIYFRTGANVSNKQVLLELGGTNSGMNVYIYSNKIWVGIWNSSQRRFFSKTITSDLNFLLTVEYNGTKVRTSLNGICSSSMLFSGFASNSNTNGIGASINGTRYMDATSGSGLSNFFGGTIAEILLYNSCDQTLRESVIDFIDTKYNTNSSFANAYTPYFGKVTELTWDLNQWEESPINTNDSENLLNVSQNKSLLKVNFESKIEADYSISLYNLNGKLIKIIYNGNLEKGLKSFETDIDQISSGSYIIEVKSNDFVESKNIIIVK